MPKLIHRVTTVIAQSEKIAHGIRLIELRDPDGWELPPFTAGSHIDVHLPSGAVRQYSLTGDPAQNDRYRIAVLEEAEGRGGSREIHRLAVGTVLPVSLPRNHFPLHAAEHHVLLAGGIGITPFMPMVAELERTGASYELHYVAGTRESAAFASELASRLPEGRFSAYFTRTDEPRRIALADLVESVGPGSRLYCCGPASMMTELAALARPKLAERFHHEAFGVEDMGQEAAYRVELARSGAVVDVPPGQTMLHALRQNGVEIDASCEGGVCLECKTRFLEGTPIHRDLAMKPEDRAEYITPCVSGCAGERIVLDL